MMGKEGVGREGNPGIAGRWIPARRDIAQRSNMQNQGYYKHGDPSAALAEAPPLYPVASYSSRDTPVYQLIDMRETFSSQNLPQ
jgi:hypothetical protein